MSKLSAVAYAHKLRSLQDPTQHFLVVKCMLGIKKSSPSVDSRLPISTEILLQLHSNAKYVTDSFYYASMLRAMMTLSFFALLRPGEVTSSPNNLLLQSVQFKDDSLQLTFYRFKHYHGPPVVLVVPPQPSPLCPVLNLQEFLSHWGTSPGPLFCTNRFCHAVCNRTPVVRVGSRAGRT